MADPIRLLYLGRSEQVAEKLQDALDHELRRSCSDSSIDLRWVAVSNQKRAMEQIRARPPHALLVESDNGRYNRVRFCTMLRNRLPNIPIFAVCRAASQASAFEFDGHILVPLDQEQAAPVFQKLLQAREETHLQVGPICLDLTTRTVDGPNGEHRLTPKQCQLLHILMEHAGQVVSREKIMQMIWDTAYLGDTRTLDVHVRWLRERIEPLPSDPVYLLTIRGIGYRLCSGDHK